MKTRAVGGAKLTLEVEVARPLQVKQGCGLAELARQLQQHTDQVLCVVNEVELRYYSQAERGLRALGTPERRGEYLFGDARGNTYRVFGKGAAHLICPAADAPASPGVPTDLLCTTVVDDEESFSFEYSAPRVRLVPLASDN